MEISIKNINHVSDFGVVTYLNIGRGTDINPIIEKNIIAKTQLGICPNSNANFHAKRAKTALLA